MAGLRTVVTVLALAFAGAAHAHFQQILPSNDTPQAGETVTLELVFTHPMEGGPVMEMKKPRRFGAMIEGAFVDLSALLKAGQREGRTIWTAAHRLRMPGAAVFYVEPEPYWEPTENKFIVHHAKVVVDAHATGHGWDAMVGAPVEIEPLVRPTGLWTGNLFRGIVRKDGKPVPFAQIEVEFVNDGSVTPPNDAFVTQVIKADANGTFAYAMPRAGWWGFAALLDSDAKMKGPKGEDASVEIGGLIWVKTTSMEGGAK